MGARSAMPDWVQSHPWAAIGAISATIVLAVWAVRACLGAMSKPGLSSHERRVVACVADAFFPRDGPLGIGGSEAGTVDYLDRYLSRSSPRARRMIHLLLWLTDVAPIFYGLRWQRFTRLEDPERRRFLVEASKSDVYIRRACLLGLRVLVTLAYFACERVARRIGVVTAVDPFGLDEARVGEPPAPLASGTRLKEGVSEQATRAARRR